MLEPHIINTQGNSQTLTKRKNADAEAEGEDAEMEDSGIAEDGKHQG
jgi:hypothetical protein